ncbi:MAG TPA: isocitrate lyase/phosphoenolpyruvate mutase family protein [Candidatus Sulfotelmatobacter sp.]|nr:isocitrate lyase/phosphoenolpyruvate mutase family protein [Candidatus Sulfotelmatobacter sp.]
MANVELSRKADALRALHAMPEPLLLPNVWDVATARIVEQAGYPAIATTSAGIAFSLGFPDGEKIPPERMLAVVAAIAKAVRVPVTADLEAGYGHKPEDAARTARKMLEAGAVGMNFEDATGESAHPLFDISLQLEKIRAIRQAGSEMGVGLVLNARTDVYLLQVGDPATRYDRAVERLRAYREAGADCVFVPGLVDTATIGRIVADLKCPVNVLAVPGAPTVAELKALGVKRISLGSGPMRAALGLVGKIARELKERGTYSGIDGAPSYAEVNKLLS